MARILVVDDDPVVLKVLVRALTSVGHACVATTSARSALALVKALGPDLLVIDYEMPGMDGASLVRALDAALPDRRLPVVFLSAYVERCAEEPIPSLVRARYLDKPFAPRALAEASAALLGRGDA